MGKAKPRRSFITSACSRTSLGYSEAQRCLAPVPRASLPFATVNFKDGEKDHEISKSQYIFSFIFPKEMDMESTPGWCGCAASDSRQRKERGENLSCISLGRQAWTTHSFYFPILPVHQSTVSPAEPVLAAQQHEKSLGHYNHGAPQQYINIFVISVICYFEVKSVLLLPLKKFKKNSKP